MSQTNGTGGAATLPTPPTVTPSEWPASATIRVTSPRGLDVLLTLRAARVADVLGQLETLEGWLIGHNWTPAPTRAQGNGQAAQPAQGQGEETPICAIHHKPMQKRPSRQGGYFWSCSEKLDDGTWCPYKPKGR